MPHEKILLVDDEPTIVTLCTRFLTQEGYQVTSASNGQSALNLFEKEPFDLLLTDIRMRGMSGFELIDAVKKIDQSVAIVVVTGHGTVSMAIESLKLGTLGFIVKPFTKDELLSAIRHAAEKNHLVKENIRLRSLMPLFEVNRRLVTTDLDLLFHQIVESARTECKADRASLMLLDDEKQELHVKVHSGFPIVIESKLTKRVGEGIAGMVAKTGKPLIIQGGVNQNPELAEKLDDTGAISSISVPLIGMEKKKLPLLTSLPHREERVIGVLNISKNNPKSIHFTESDMEMVTLLSGQAAAAIENATLYKDLHESYLKTIRALVGTIELKDSYTSGHSENVSRYATALALEMGLGSGEADDVAIAGLLHDIGKIGSSEDILLKQGKLTDQEYAAMKIHPQSAVKLLTAVGLSENILNIVLHHHEHYNGKGYPEGLSQNKIPMGARILMVADTIDAMTTNRPYRPIQPIKTLASELKKYSGSQFDPLVVDAFDRLLEKNGPGFFCHQNHLHSD